MFLVKEGRGMRAYEKKITMCKRVSIRSIRWREKRVSIKNKRINVDKPLRLIIKMLNINEAKIKKIVITKNSQHIKRKLIDLKRNDSF